MLENSNLSPRQLTAIQLLAIGTPIYRVAEQVGVTTMTISRWRKHPIFSARLNTIATSGLEEFAKKLNATALTALEVLQQELCDLRLPAPLRIRASLGVLRAVGPVNAALEKGLQHRLTDFDVKDRWSGPAYTYAADGSPVRADEHRTMLV